MLVVSEPRQTDDRFALSNASPIVLGKWTEPAELRRAGEITQEALAEALDTTQSGVSRLEHQRDLHLSTLLRYVEALGGRVEITAVFDDERLSIVPN